MAITTICSSPPTTLPSLKTLHLPLRPSLLSSSSKNNLNLLSNEALSVFASAAEAVALATAALHAAREAATLARGDEEVWFGGESGSVVEVRRSRSRRKKWTEGYEEKGSSHGGGRRGGGGGGVLVKSKKSSEEEAEFCLCLKEGARLEEERRRITEAQENESISKQLAKAMGIKQREIDKILCRERESQERITRSCRRLVVSIASGYQGKGLSLQDLIQEGSIRLIRGAKRFDPTRGYKLSTYVYWWIKQAIIKAIADKSRIIRLPGSMCGMLAKIAEANNALTRRLRRLPTSNEIADVLDINVSTVRLTYQRTRHPVSLDRAETNQGLKTLQDIIPGPDETTPEKMVEKQRKKQDLEKLLQTLSEREAYILRLHFGLNGETPQSCEEIGTRLKLTGDRIRQISGIALKKLRQTSTVDNLQVYIV